MTGNQIAWRLKTRRWVRAGKGVYQHAASASTPLSRLLAACLASGGVASHRSAAALHGIDGYQLDRIEVVVPWKRAPVTKGFELHRTTQMSLTKPVTRSGVLCTWVGRTVLDVASVVSRERLEHTIDAVLRQGLLRLEDLYAVLVSHSRQGRTGCGPFRDAPRSEGVMTRCPSAHGVAWSRICLSTMGSPARPWSSRSVTLQGSLLRRLTWLIRIIVLPSNSTASDGTSTACPSRGILGAATP